MRIRQRENTLSLLLGSIYLHIRVGTPAFTKAYTTIIYIIIHAHTHILIFTLEVTKIMLKYLLMIIDNTNMFSSRNNFAKCADDLRHTTL